MVPRASGDTNIKAFRHAVLVHLQNSFAHQTVAQKKWIGIVSLQHQAQYCNNRCPYPGSNISIVQVSISCSAIGLKVCSRTVIWWKRYMQVVHLPGVELCSTPQQDSIQFLEHLLDCMYLVAKSCHFLAKIWLWLSALTSCQNSISALA